MTRSEKKQEERDDVDLFLRLLSPDTVELKPRPHEAPDFILVGRDSQIGLEVARVTDASVNAHTNEIKRFRRQLLAELARQDLPITLNLDFRWPHPAVTKKLLSRTNRSNIILLVRDLLKGGVFPATLAADQLRERGIDGIQELWATDSGTPLVMDSRMIVGRSATLVEETISAKDTKLSTYRSRNPGLHAFWLLLVSGRGYAEPVWDEISKLELSSSFDRLFLLDAHRNQRTLHEISRH